VSYTIEKVSRFDQRFFSKLRSSGRINLSHAMSEIASIGLDFSSRRLCRAPFTRPSNSVDSSVLTDFEISDCFHSDEAVSFAAIARLMDYLETLNQSNFDCFCMERFPYQRFVDFSKTSDGANGSLAFLCLELACNFAGVSLSFFESSMLVDLLFEKIEDQDPDQSDAAFHIIADLSFSGEDFLDELIASGLLGRMRSAQPTAHFGSLFTVLCSRKCEFIVDVLGFLPTVLLSEDAKCVEFGLRAIRNCACANPDQSGLLADVVIRLAPLLFDRPESEVTKQLFRCLADCVQLPVSFAQVVFARMTTAGNSALLNLGCRIFRRQFSFWKGSVPDSLCNFIFTTIDHQNYACHKSCLQTLVLYYDGSGPFLNRFCELLIRHMENSSLSVHCLGAMLGISRLAPASASLLAPAFSSLTFLAASDDPEVSELAQLLLAALSNENGEFLISPLPTEIT
jgi:hypothetical protein